VLCFRKVSGSIFSMISGARALSSALQRMIGNREDVEFYLGLFEFMSANLFKIAEMAEKAVISASTAFHR